MNDTIRGNSGIGNAQEGGTQGYLFGQLKRRLKSIPLCRFTSGEESITITENTTFKLLIKGLTGVLNIHIAVGIESIDNTPVRPSDVPAGGATMQLIPINLFPDVAKKVFLREVFQDPTLAGTDNGNHPLPMDIPFGWEGSTEADQVELDVDVNVIGADESSPWEGTLINGRLIAQVTIEYNGQWWDSKAIQQALSQVTFEGEPSDLGTVNTSGGE